MGKVRIFDCFQKEKTSSSVVISKKIGTEEILEGCRARFEEKILNISEDTPYRLIIEKSSITFSLGEKDDIKLIAENFKKGTSNVREAMMDVIFDVKSGNNVDLTRVQNDGRLIIIKRFYEEVLNLVRERFLLNHIRINHYTFISAESFENRGANKRIMNFLNGEKMDYVSKNFYYTNKKESVFLKEIKEKLNEIKRNIVVFIGDSKAYGAVELLAFYSGSFEKYPIDIEVFNKNIFEEELNKMHCKNKLKIAVNGNEEELLQVFSALHLANYKEIPWLIWSGEKEEVHEREWKTNNLGIGRLNHTAKELKSIVYKKTGSGEEFSRWLYHFKGVSTIREEMLSVAIADANFFMETSFLFSEKTCSVTHVLRFYLKGDMLSKGGREKHELFIHPKKEFLQSLKRLVLKNEDDGYIEKGLQKYASEFMFLDKIHFSDEVVAIIGDFGDEIFTDGEIIDTGHYLNEEFAKLTKMSLLNDLKKVGNKERVEEIMPESHSDSLKG